MGRWDSTYVITCKVCGRSFDPKESTNVFLGLPDNSKNSYCCLCKDCGRKFVKIFDDFIKESEKED